MQKLRIVISINIIILSFTQFVCGQAVEIDSTYLSELKQKRKEILEYSSEFTPYVWSSGSYAYTYEKYSEFTSKGSATIYLLPKSENAIKLPFKKDPEFTGYPFILLVRDSSFNIILTYETFHSLKDRWNCKVLSYFTAEGKIFTSEISGVQEVGLDHFDEARMVKYFNREGKLIHTENSCKGASSACTGFSSITYRHWSTVAKLLAGKRIKEM